MRKPQADARPQPDSLGTEQRGSSGKKQVKTTKKNISNRFTISPGEVYERVLARCNQKKYRFGDAVWVLINNGTDVKRASVCNFQTLKKNGTLRVDLNGMQEDVKAKNIVTLLAQVDNSAKDIYESVMAEFKDIDADNLELDDIKAVIDLE